MRPIPIARGRFLREKSALRRAVAGLQLADYRRGEAYQRAAPELLLGVEGIEARYERIDRTFLNWSPAELEWLAAVARHFTVEHVDEVGTVILAALLQYLQARGASRAIGAPSKFRVGSSTVGSLSADQMLEARGAALVERGAQLGWPMPPRLFGEYFWLGELPHELLLPLDGPIMSVRPAGSVD